MDAEERYRCPDCSKLHSDEFDAENCCPRDIDRVWLCGKCEKEYPMSFGRRDSEAQRALAEACCKDEEGFEIITKLDLEEEGQQRLWQRA